MPKPRIGKKMRYVVDKLTAGQRLRFQHTPPYYFWDGGAEVDPAVVRRCEAAGLIKPAQDGLFGTSQTYVLS